VNFLLIEIEYKVVMLQVYIDDLVVQLH
jgi:hypothetical protein